MKKILCAVTVFILLFLTLSVYTFGTGNYSVEIVSTIAGEVNTTNEFTLHIEKIKITDDVSDETASIPVGDLKFKGNYTYSFTDMSEDFKYLFSLKSSDSKSISVDTNVFEVMLEDGNVAVSGNSDDSAKIIFNSSKKKTVKIDTNSCKAVTKVYDGTTAAKITASNYNITGIAGGEDVTVKYTSAEYNSADVAAAKSVKITGLTLTGKDAEKYVLEKDSLTCEGIITRRPIKIIADSITVTKGSAEPQLTYKTSEELAKGEKPVGELTRKPGNEPGEYAITQGTLTLDNYEIEFIDGVLTISEYALCEATDSSSNVRISGFFGANAVFAATSVSSDDSSCQSFGNATAWGNVIGAYMLSLDSSYDGMLTFTFPVPSMYNGKEITIYRLNSEGAIVANKETVLNESVSVTADTLGIYMLVAEIDTADDTEGCSVFGTIMKILLIIILVILGIAVVLALVFFGMVYFNKTKELKKIIRTVKKLFRK